jgi:hypothetical protein
MPRMEENLGQGGQNGGRLRQPLSLPFRDQTCFLCMAAADQTLGFAFENLVPSLPFSSMLEGLEDLEVRM